MNLRAWKTKSRTAVAGQRCRNKRSPAEAKNFYAAVAQQPVVFTLVLPTTRHAKANVFLSGQIESQRVLTTLNGTEIQTVGSTSPVAEEGFLTVVIWSHNQVLRKWRINGGQIAKIPRTLITPWQCIQLHGAIQNINWVLCWGKLHKASWTCSLAPSLLLHCKFWELLWETAPWPSFKAGVREFSMSLVPCILHFVRGLITVTELQARHEPLTQCFKRRVTPVRSTLPQQWTDTLLIYSM